MTDAGRVLKGVTDKDSRAVLKRAVRAGCTVEITNSQHVKVTTPSGAIIRTGLTSSDHRAHRYLERDLRRAGVEI